MDVIRIFFEILPAAGSDRWGGFYSSVGVFVFDEFRPIEWVCRRKILCSIGKYYVPITTIFCDGKLSTVFKLLSLVVYFMTLSAYRVHRVESYDG
jgi:hypothetical protein